MPSVPRMGDVASASCWELTLAKEFNEMVYIDLWFFNW